MELRLPEQRESRASSQSLRCRSRSCSLRRLLLRAVGGGAARITGIFAANPVPLVVIAAAGHAFVDRLIFGERAGVDQLAARPSAAAGAIAIVAALGGLLRVAYEVDRAEDILRSRAASDHLHRAAGVDQALIELG